MGCATRELAYFFVYCLWIGKEWSDLDRSWYISKWFYSDKFSSENVHIRVTSPNISRSLVMSSAYVHILLRDLYGHYKIYVCPLSKWLFPTGTVLFKQLKHNQFLFTLNVSEHVHLMFNIFSYLTLQICKSFLII